MYVQILQQLLKIMFPANTDNLSYFTRHASDFKYSNTKLDFCSKSIFYHGEKVWNDIPLYVKNSLKNKQTNKKQKQKQFQVLLTIKFWFQKMTIWIKYQ